MKPRNLISVFQGDFVIDQSNLDSVKRFKALKSHEIKNMRSFCSEMINSGCDIGHFDGFFVSYNIAQINKEFDMLRFGEDYVLNIELKSELESEQKILKQMRLNHYYLKFLDKPLRIFTYVENVGYYEYIIKNDAIKQVKPNEVASCLIDQQVDNSIDPDKKFVPSKYLISPFNSTTAFILSEYFLTNAQQKIKNEIKKELIQNPFMFFCISANAGTGKTLLMYDIVKEQMGLGKKIQIIHCGKLNYGHQKLIDDYGWDIVSIRDIPNKIDEISLEGVDYVFVDEAQRIHESQLKGLTENAVKKNVPMFFSFDTKQYLKDGETCNVTEYLQAIYPNVLTLTKTLTTKIRTNKAMASFITNLMKIGKSNDNLNYDCVTIEYMNNLDCLKAYVAFLEKTGWTAITYTTSQLRKESYDQIAGICKRNAHDVIGQEFTKVVFVMDDNFYYDKSRELAAKGSYYSAKGMLYQIVTRVVEELKVIVLNNPELYINLLEIKAMDQSTG